MNTIKTSEQESAQLQERLAQAAIEDTRLPAEQILAEQNNQEECPSLFVP